MEKVFKDPQKPTEKAKIEKSVGSMSNELKSIYEDFYSDTDKLEAEWNLCLDKYNTAIQASMAKETPFEAKMLLRKISTYWQQRKFALEKAISIEILNLFKSKIV